MFAFTLAFTTPLCWQYTSRSAADAGAQVVAFAGRSVTHEPRATLRYGSLSQIDFLLDDGMTEQITNDFSVIEITIHYFCLRPLSVSVAGICCFSPRALCPNPSSPCRTCGKAPCRYFLQCGLTLHSYDRSLIDEIDSRIISHWVRTPSIGNISSRPMLCTTCRLPVT